MAFSQTIFLRLLASAAVLSLPSFAHADEPATQVPVVFADFENGSFGESWTVEGTAFGAAPALGAGPGQNLSGWKGNGLANSYRAGGGDGATGKLTSPEFDIRQPYIAFLIGGGNHPEGQPQTVNVHLEVDGKSVRSATARNSDAMEWCNWNVSEFNGKRGRLVIEDASTGGWGHIEVDQIVFSPFEMPDFAVASVFGDHMVLQREKPVTIWGKARTGETVRASFGSQSKEATADATMHWSLKLDPMPASEQPLALTVEDVVAGGEKITFQDVLVGEVWIASGQSNMGFSLNGCLDAGKEIAGADLPTLRFIQVPQSASKTPRETLAAKWQVATPKSVPGLSGVAYFFGKSINTRLKIPVGIIHSSFGGTPAESWSSPEMLSSDPALKEAMEHDLAELAKLDADPTTTTRPNRLTLPFASAGGLYNAMIHPLIPTTFRGVIWYQGESNAFKAERYRSLLTMMIGDWRARFGQGDFPFYLVQLANYYAPVTQPVPADKRSTDDWVARLREAQLQVSRSVPETGMAVAIDIGEETIHPRNKQDVGDRLARIALAKTYGLSDVEYQSPIYESMKKEGPSIRVNFTDCPGGLMVAQKAGVSGSQPTQETHGEKLKHFAIAGADRKFVWADATIDGSSVVVSSPEVPDPIAVRYAWALDPLGCNLYGKNGLPASPFRTDDWPLPEK